MLYIWILAAIFGLIILFTGGVMVKDYFDEKRLQKILRNNPELRKSYTGYLQMRKFYKNFADQNIIPREKRLHELLVKYAAETNEVEKKELAAQIARAKQWIKSMKTKNEKNNNYHEYAVEFWKQASQLSPITFKFLKRFFKQDGDFYGEL